LKFAILEITPVLSRVFSLRDTKIGTQRYVPLSFVLQV